MDDSKIYADGIKGGFLFSRWERCGNEFEKVGTVTVIGGRVVSRTGRMGASVSECAFCGRGLGEGFSRTDDGYPICRWDATGLTD